MTGSAEGSTSNVEVVRRLNGAFERGDIEGQLALLSPDVEIAEWPNSPDSSVFRGHAGARQALERWLQVWEWLRNDVEDIIESGERVLFCARTRGKGKGSEIEVETDAYNVYTVEDGKVTRIELFTTKEPALRAAGLTEEALEGSRAR